MHSILSRQMWPTHLLVLFSLPRVSDGTSGVWMRVVLFIALTVRTTDYLFSYSTDADRCLTSRPQKVEPSYQLYRSASKLRPLLVFCGHDKNMSQKSANAKRFPCVKYETKNYVKLKYSTAFLTRTLSKSWLCATSTRVTPRSHLSRGSAHHWALRVKDIWNIQMYI